MKFLWDPGYVAAKKKPLAERSKNIQECSRAKRTKKKKVHGYNSVEKENLPDIDENMPVTFNISQNNLMPVENEVSENDLTPAVNEVPENVDVKNPGDGHGYFAKTNAVKYVNGVLDLRKNFFLAILCCLPLNTQSQEMSSQSVSGDVASASPFPWWILFVALAFVFGRFYGHRREILF